VKHLGSALSVTLIAASVASAQIVIDGTVDANYGAALSIQNTNTGFGDFGDGDGDPRTNGGSEIDAVYGTVSGGFLNLFIAGNLESNFNKLEIFIDSEVGGVNVLDGANLPTAVDGYCCTLPSPQNFPDPASGALQRMSGLTFDAGFTADHYFTTSNGSESGGPLLSPWSGWIATTHYAQLNAGSGGASASLGGVTSIAGDELDALGVSRGLQLGTLIDQNNNLFAQANPADDIALHEFFEPFDITDTNNVNNHRNTNNTLGVLMGVDNSNDFADNGDLLNPIVIAGGVIGDNDGLDVIASPEFVTLAGQVMTGFEYAIPLAAIGNPTGDIKVTAFINGSGHDFAANQFSGEGVLQPNLGSGDGTFNGSLSNLNLSTITGDQFVTISQAVAPIAGDLDGSGLVDILDLNIVLSQWNTNGSGDPRANTDGNSIVDILDLNVVLADWNKTNLPPAAGGVVPEPATLGLVVLGGMAMLRRRR